MELKYGTCSHCGEKNVVIDKDVCEKCWYELGFHIVEKPIDEKQLVIEHLMSDMKANDCDLAKYGLTLNSGYTIKSVEVAHNTAYTGEFDYENGVECKVYTISLWYKDEGFDEWLIATNGVSCCTWAN